MRSSIFEPTISEVRRMVRERNTVVYRLLPIIDEFQKLVANKVLRLINRDEAFKVE